jgi:serpin B
MKYSILGMLAVMMLGGDGGPKVGDKASQVDGNNRFAAELYGALRERSGNVFLSPYSISSALAMTYAGAKGETAEQMARTLHFEGSPETLHAIFEQPKGGRGDTPFTLNVSNALWGQEGDHFLPEFVQRLGQHYAAGLRRVDFRSPTARQIINTWVEEQTAGKIKDLLKPPLPTPDTSLVLTNAIYFKAAWAAPFTKAATKDEPFLVTPDRDVSVPMMHRTGSCRYYDAGKHHVLELPYSGGDVAMIVLLPKDKTAEVPDFDAKAVANSVAKLAPRQVEVTLPRFKVEAEFELQKVLVQLGMSLAFSTKADFSGINGKRDLFLSAVVHKAYVDVNEAGTEAAAATAVLVTRGAAIRPAPPLVFRADHPFLFAIRDNRSGSLLFMGRLTDPRG